MLKHLQDAPRRPLVLHAAHGLGKTCFLMQDLRDAAWGAGLRPLHIALSVNTSPRADTVKALANLLHDLTGDHAHEGEATTDISRLISALRRVESHRPLLLMLDDADALMRSRSSIDALLALLRAGEEHPSQVWLLMAAATGPALQNLLSHPRLTALSPALQQELPQLDSGFVEALAQRWPMGPDESTATREQGLQWAYEQLLLRPGELTRFAEHWARDPAAPVDRALARYRALHSPDRQYTTRFMRCTPLQQQLLVQVATGQHELYALATREQLAERLQRTPAVPVPEIDEALRAMETLRWISRGGTAGTQLLDEGFARWLRALNAPDALAVPQVPAGPQSSAESSPGNSTSV